MPETNTTLERAIDQGAIDLETGEFPLVLATQGEATDGNVLDIRGASIPDSVPLIVNHQNSPLQTIGTIFGIRRGTKQGFPVLRAIGRIELDGEGVQCPASTILDGPAEVIVVDHRRTWRPMLERVGLPPMPFHALRHTHASMLLAAGVHAKIVQERLGHSSIMVTMDIYSHVLVGLQREAARAPGGRGRHPGDGDACPLDTRTEPRGPAGKRTPDRLSRALGPGTR